MASGRSSICGDLYGLANRCATPIMGVRKSGGDMKWLEINSQAVQDAKGQSSMVVVSFTDITNTRQQMDV